MIVLKASEINSPIIKSVIAYHDYPYKRIDKDIFKLYFQHHIDIAQSRNIYTQQSLLKLIECYCDITNQHLTRDHLITSNKSFFDGFLGALYSDAFFYATNESRYTYAYNFLNFIESINSSTIGIFNQNIQLSHKRPSNYLIECMRIFDDLELDEEKVWLWRGWPSTNRNGKTTWFPLYYICERLGTDFTKVFYNCCDSYFSSRRADGLNALSAFAAFIRIYPGELIPDVLKSPIFITYFWREFLYYFYNSKKDSQGPTISRNWREFCLFIQQYLVPSGLFSLPSGELPNLPIKRKRGPQCHIKESHDGLKVKTKLLTPIPLQISDYEAMDLLFRKIQEDFDLIIRWAEWAVEDIWKRYSERIELQTLGKPRLIQNVGGFRNSSDNLWQTDRSNPDYLKNASATLAHYGYITRKEISSMCLIFPQPLSKTAYELALPGSGSLLPHCILLIANHPEITPSFLEKFELFDKNGKREGFKKLDSGYVICGHKDRCGPHKSHKIIKLNEFTTNIFNQIITLTDPLRSYLKNNNDDNWRYLLLTCQKGFSYPARIHRLTTDTSDKQRIERLAISMGNVTTLSYEERLRYLKNFSLPALRASAGVLIYLKERSVNKMAKALGHSEYSPKLLSHYLPDPILSFFQERWIRIFQEGIIVEALKNSDYLLKASSFDSMEELNAFLQNHTLKIIPDNLLNHNDNSYYTDSSERTPDTNVVFGVNTEILTAMISLKMAVNNASTRVSGAALYWTNITNYIVGFIESEKCTRDDLRKYVTLAKRNADPSIMEKLIYD